MKMIKRITFAMLALLTFSIAAQAATSIAVVDSQQLLQASPAFADAQAKIKKAFAPKQTAIENQEKALQDKMTKYKRDEPVMKQSQKEDAQKAIIAMQQKIMAEKQKFEQDLQTEQKKALVPVFASLRETIEKVASQKSYDIVLQKNTIAYAKPSLDITQDVIKALPKK